MSNFNRKIKYLIILALSVFCIIPTIYSQNSFIGVFSHLTGPAKFNPFQEYYPFMFTHLDIYKTKDKGLLYCYLGAREWDENKSQFINVIKYDSLYTPLWHKIYMTTEEAMRPQIMEDSLGSIFLVYNQHDSMLYKIGISKLNPDGNIIWTKMLLDRSRHSQFRYAMLAQNGDLIISGYRIIEPGNIQEALAMRVNGDGEIVWQKLFGGISRFFNDVTETKDGSLLFTAWDGAVVKLNAGGAVLWANFYDKNDIRTVLEDKEGNYVVATAPTGSVSVASKCRVFSISPTGELLWKKDYFFDFWAGEGNGLFGGFISQMKTSLQIVLWTVNNSKMIFLNTDYGGNINWASRLQGDGWFALKDLNQAMDDGILVPFFCNDGLFDYKSKGFSGVIMTDPDGGIPCVEKLYDPPVDVVDIALTAPTPATGVQNASFKFADFSLEVEDAPMVTLEMLCYATAVRPEPGRRAGFSIYPNPATEMLNIRTATDVLASQAELRVYDLMGRLMHVQETFVNTGMDISIDISRLPEGMYVAELKTSDSSFFEKFIIQR
ncbi:MAG TPA: T9SS type A sorting domain-containing protein [Saprospiraceae bacterium]|nr:T9SS type A sorting domain-containing protein [Saprospiraceae bacterium]HMW74128.1 T9SS type A sorting domain-containing protein [Saprospiraceae bacterium]HMX82613.1 T9SS type A sorting domain-containing protein [Saprospiraceae bacterium]HMX84351.1 T9SS type A sorting domain-containing protein [Saprospiraceae bacterium]HMZ74059.1 T9SS type A sorting domain-containing protein [Saprospiraceae bacterium]